MLGKHKLNGSNNQVTVHKRPFVEDFLKDMSGHFDLILFTASQKPYASKVIKIIDPADKFFKLKLFRDNCIDTKNMVRH